MSRLAILGSRGYPSSYSGFETLVRQLAPYLVDRGHEVTVYGHQPSSLQSRTEVTDGIDVRYTPGWAGKSTSTLSFGFSAARDAAKSHFDAALILNVANGMYIQHLKNSGLPTAVNVDGMEWLRAKWNGLGKRAFLRGAHKCVQHADALVYDSTALGGEWEAKFGRSGTFIPYGAPVLEAVADDLLVAKGIPVGSYVLAVCRIVPENNVDLLLDALDLLPPDLTVVIVGDSNYPHGTVARLGALHQQKRVLWLGHVSDQELLNQLWAHASVYWHGHSVGGTNPSLLQALGAGAPVLALDTPFNREVIGRDEQLIPLNVQVLGRCITEVATNQALQRSMGEWGQEVVRRNYQWDAVCKSYEQLLLGLRRR